MNHEDRIEARFSGGPMNGKEKTIKAGLPFVFFVEKPKFDVTRIPLVMPPYDPRKHVYRIRSYDQETNSALYTYDGFK